MEILNGVHQIKSPFPGGVFQGYTNIYVLEGSDGNIVIDSGWDSQECLWAFQEGLKAERLSLRDIKKVIVTHIHPDHYGLSAKIRQICGAQVAIHKADAVLINSRYKDFLDLLKKNEEMLRQNGVPEEELIHLKDASLWMNKYVTPELPEVMLEGGEVIDNGSFRLEVVWTPGHSPGHICLYEREKKFVLTGDHVLFDTTPHISFNPQSGPNPLKDYISSLKKLASLETRFALPGHGPMFNALNLRIERILQHHEQRKDAIVRCLRQGTKTAYQIAQEIPWMVDQGGISFRDLSFWDKRMAVTETIAHLKLLIEEDRVSSAEMGGSVLYLAKE